MCIAILNYIMLDVRQECSSHTASTAGSCQPLEAQQHVAVSNEKQGDPSRRRGGHQFLLPLTLSFELASEFHFRKIRSSCYS